MTTVYLILTTLINLLMSVIWAKDDWVNTTIKILFIVAFIMGLVLVMMDFGFVHKT